MDKVADGVSSGAYLTLINHKVNGIAEGWARDPFFRFRSPQRHVSW